jgi:3-phosphoglycerate kinase
MFDHGPDSLKVFNSAVSRAESIFWNGPIGVF